MRAPIPFVIPINVPAKFGDKSRALTFMPWIIWKLGLQNELVESLNKIELTRIVSAHECHRDCEQAYRDRSVTSSVRSCDKKQSRDCEGQSREELSRVCDANVSLGEAPVADDAEYHRANPHREVRQRWVKTIFLNIELKNIGHVLWQVSYDSKVSDAVTNLCDDSEKITDYRMMHEWSFLTYNAIIGGLVKIAFHGVDGRFLSLESCFSSLCR